MAIKVVPSSYGTEVWTGEHMLACITSATPQSAVDKFIGLCIDHEGYLTSLGIEYEARVAQNRASNGQGKSWPIFAKRERFINQLCRMAGIVDT